MTSTRLRPSPLLVAAALAAALAPRPGLAADGDRGPPSIAIDVGALDLPAPPLAPGPDAVALAPRPVTPPQPLGIDLGPRPDPPPRRGALRPGGLAVPTAEVLATNLVIMEWNRRIGDAAWADVSIESIGRNLRSAWVLDDDDYWVNQFAHPYQGTWSFTAARSSGLGFWASAPFTFGASALWEVTGETMPPSVNDQVTTTVAGVALGEVLYRFAGGLRAGGGAWREVLAGVLAPMGALNHQLVGTQQAIPLQPSRWRVALGGAAFTGEGPSGGRETLPYGGLSFTYGLPGAADLELERPFDHFVVEVDWTAAADPASTVRARGLLAGATFDGDVARGLYGAFLSFDFATPPGHRVSTSAIGFGGSASAELGRGFAVEGDAVASAVLLGAGGTMDRAPDADRDYRFGPGQQALLALRMLAGSRATAEVSLRQYLLFSGDGGGGSELLLHGTASAAVRVIGASGLGVEVSRYLRRADLGVETVRRADSVVRVYLVVGGA